LSANDLALEATFDSSRRGMLRPMRPEGRNRFGSVPSATGGIARLACAAVSKTELPLAPLLDNAGLSVAEIEDAARRLEVRAQIKVLELAAAAIGDDLLGFHLARDFDLGEIGLPYYVMASSENLAEALRNAERYSAIANEGIRLKVRSDLDPAIEIRYDHVDRSSDRHQIEFWLVALVRICRKITDSRLAPLRIRVRHSHNGAAQEFKSFFGCSIDFGSDADEIVLSKSVYSLPSIGGDPHLHNLLVGYANEALARRSLHSEVGFKSKAEDVLIKLLPHGRANSLEVARQLGMSRRTLTRALSEEGTSFSEVLEGSRKALATRYLRERELPVSQIAWLLGYREVSSFTHAFKRWTGMTPRQLRLTDQLPEQ
jgi:AraC-like DNA-binding protein